MLRSLLVWAIIIALGTQVQAQTAVQKQPLNLNKKAVKAAVAPKGSTHKVRATTGNETSVPNTHPGNHQLTTNQRSGAGTVIGTTTYDLQSNYGSCRRVWNNNGTIHATWTMSNSFDAASADRGTGYNVSTDGGNTWGAAPTARIEGAQQRTGWPNVGTTASGRVFSCTHTPDKGLLFTYRDPGSTTWTKKYVGEENGDLTGVWPRMGVDGNNIHVVISRQDEFDGMTGGLAYFRSTDGGNTWEGPTALPSMAENYVEMGADIYFVDVKGNHVAIVIGTYARRVVLYESNDNGVNWNYRVVKDTSFPLIPADPALPTDVLDPVAVSGGCNAMLIDGDDVVHIWYDRVFNYQDDPTGASGAGPFYLPNSACIMYWNSNMGGEPVVLGQTVRQDYNQDDTTQINTTAYEIQSYGVSLVGQGSAGMDAQGNLYLAYSSMVDGNEQPPNDATVGGRLFRDIYLIKSTDGGQTWQGPLNITADNGNREAVFPAIAAQVDGFVHVIYQEDDLTGNALQNTNSQGQSIFTVNDIVYQKIAVGDIVNPSPEVNSPPSINYLNVPYAIENCSVTADRFDAHALDYPDGLVDIEVGGTVNVDVPNETGAGYYWLLNATDSDNNTFTEHFLDSTTGTDAAIFVYPDDTAPEIFGEPVEFFIDPADGLEYYNSLFDFFAEVDVLQGSTYEDLGAVVRDDADTFGCPATLTVNNPVNTAAIGQYTVTYNAIDNVGNQAEAVTRTVNVIGADTDGPVIYVFSVADGAEVTDGTTIDVEADPSSTFNIEDYFDVIGIDNVDGDVTAEITQGGAVDLGTNGTYPLTFTVTDAAGNASTFSVTVNVQDTQAPVITLGGPANLVFTNCGATFVDPTGTTAIDNVDGNLTPQITVSGCIYTACAGNYQRRYTVCDASGNCTEVIRTVIVAAACSAGCPVPADIDLSNPSCAVGMETIGNYEFLVAPNPTTGIINIATPNVNDHVSINIYSVSGALVQNIERDITHNVTIAANLSDAPNGMYFVNVTTSKGSFTSTITLQK